MISFIDQSEDHGVVVGPDGTSVQVMFASDEATLGELQAAAA